MRPTRCACSWGHLPRRSPAPGPWTPCADRVVARPELVDALRDGAADPVAALDAVDPDVADELDAWLNAHAWRPTNYEPGSPAVIERPGVVTRLLLHDDVPIDDSVAAQAEAEALAQLADDDRGPFLAALEQARRIYPVREENVVLTDNVPCGILRRWVLEAGRRLVGGGRLGRVDDAVFCTAEELAEALQGGTEALEPLVAQSARASSHGPAPIPVRPSSASSTKCPTSATSLHTDGA